MALRTVGVRLKAEVSEYQSKIRSASASVKGFSDKLTDAARKGDASATALAKGAGKVRDAVDDMGDAADDAADELDELRRAAGRLDGQIAETALTIRNLAREIVTTSDRASRAKLLGDLAAQRQSLRDLVDLRKTIGVDLGEKLGSDVASRASVSFAARFGPLLARAPMAGVHPAVAAIGAPLVAGLTTVVGAGVSAAIVGGVGVGGVIGGIALAGRHPAVKREAELLGADLGELLGRSARTFVPEVLDAMGTIRARAADAEDDLTRLFSSASRHLDPFLDGLLDAGEELLPGLIDAVDTAGPVVDALAEAARDLGDAVSDGLSSLSDNADEGARALSMLLNLVEGGIRLTFGLLNVLSEVYEKGSLLAAALTLNAKKFVEIAVSNELAKRSADGLESSLDDLINGIRDVGGEAISAEEAIKILKEAFDELFAADIGYDRALIAYKEGVRDLNRELKEGKRTLDINTQAGRDNVKAILDQIAIIKELRDKRLEQGESTEVVNEKYRDEIGLIREKLEKLGFEQKEIDKLLEKYERVPDEVSTRVTADVSQAERELDKVRELISKIRSKKVVITTQHNQIITRSEGRNTPIGDGVGGRRWGGITEYAQFGTLRQAQIASPMGPARYGWAEPATGGELFAPKFGDLDRTRALVSYAVENWWGGWKHFAPPTPVPVPVDAPSAPPEVRVFIGDRELTDIVRVEISEHDRYLRRRVAAGVR